LVQFASELHEPAPGHVAAPPQRYAPQTPLGLDVFAASTVQVPFALAPR
jgi:hypothetical protein